MPRVVEISLPSDRADEVVPAMREVPGVVGIVRQRGASIVPAGDVVVLQTTNEALHSVFRILDELRIPDEGTILTSAPSSLRLKGGEDPFESETNETIWDEMAHMLREDTNVGSNYLLLMALSGAISAIGLHLDQLHVVIASMVIAPAFEPLVRMPMGLIAGPLKLARSGVWSTVLGYLSLAGGGLTIVILLQLLQPGAVGDLESREWVRFWSTVTPGGAIAAVLGGTAGAIVVTSQRPVLTTGVMIALALIPSLTIAGMALGSGDIALAGRGLQRWLVDAVIVTVAAAIVLWLKQRAVHRRRERG